MPVKRDEEEAFTISNILNQPTDRRSFLKWSASLGAALTAARGGLGLGGLRAQPADATGPEKKAVKKAPKKKTAKKPQTPADYLKVMETELKRIEKQINSLKLKKKMDKQLKTNYDKTMKVLNEQKKQANKKLREAKSAWRELSKGFEGAWKQLSKSVISASKKFK